MGQKESEDSKITLSFGAKLEWFSRTHSVIYSHLTTRETEAPGGPHSPNPAHVADILYSVAGQECFAFLCHSTSSSLLVIKLFIAPTRLSFYHLQGLQLLSGEHVRILEMGCPSGGFSSHFCNFLQDYALTSKVFVPLLYRKTMSVLCSAWSERLPLLVCVLWLQMRLCDRLAFSVFDSNHLMRHLQEVECFHLSNFISKTLFDSKAGARVVNRDSFRI